MALKGFGRYTVAANSDGTTAFSRRSVVESNDFNNLTGTNIIPSASTKNLLDSFLARDLKTTHELGRDIYHNDPISGATVDLLSNLPYSDFNLSTVDDKEVLDKYLKGLENMRLSTLIPDIARDRYVIGCFVGVLNFNNSLGVYDSVIPQNIDETEIIEVPIHGMDPLITIRPSAAIKKLVSLAKTDKRIKPIIDSLPDFLVEAATRRKKIAVDPMNLLFMKRGGMAIDHLGRSIYTRVYLIWLIEKALMRGTVDQAYKRQRGILHLQVGEEDWVPTASELQQLADLFIQADLDSTGATIATRNGINANELRCLSGDTIIPTSKGLMRIADMVDHDPKKLKAGTAFNTDILVKNHLGKYVKVSDWWYQGFKPTFRITTESGSHITCTENHKFPTIVNGEYKLIKAKDLLVGKSHVLRSTLPKSEGTSELNVDISYLKSQVESRWHKAHIDLPTHMTPDLAYVLGMIISEGYINENTISVTNTDKRILNKYTNCCKAVFNDPGIIRTQSLQGESTFKDGSTHKTKRCENAEIYSRLIIKFLDALGIKKSADLRTSHRSPSYKKSVPECILKADRDCQLSFLAAYIDGDGCIGRGRNYAEYLIYSTSQKILNSCHLILSNLGYLSNLKLEQERVEVPASESARLHLELAPYAIKHRKENKNKVAAKKLGIPAHIFIPTLLDRERNRRNKPGGISGTWFENDDGENVLIEGGWKSHFKHYIYQSSPNYSDSRSYLLYDRIESGDYDHLLEIINKVSPNLYKVLMRLYKMRAKFEKVTSITECKKEHVYDLTMDAGHSAPYFIANGFITKNSGGEFWKVGDVSDWAGQQKLRAFGVSEAFLSGDSNFSTVDAALSVFMDNIRTERNFLTQELFYDKIFPAIAIANDFKKSKKHMEIAAEEIAQYTQRDRFSNPYKTGVYRDEKGKLIGVYSGNRSSTIAKSLNSINDITQYIIPELHWHKQLQPEGDSQYIQILQELQQLGVPIPLRMIAAAGGVDVDKLLQGKDDDIKLRESLADYQKEIQKLSAAGQPDMGGPDGMEQAALKFISKLGSSGGSVKKVAFKDREFGDLLQPHQLDKSGNKRVLSKKGQELVNERFNKTLAAVVAEKARQANWKLKNGIVD